MIDTPCRGICLLDKEKQRCKGCGRTRKHIAEWKDYSDRQRRDIMRALPTYLELEEEYDLFDEIRGIRIRA